MLLTLLFIAGITSCSAKETPLPTATSAAIVNLRQLTVFDELDQIIQDEFLYDDFGGVDWSSLTNQLRDQIQEGMSDEAFYDALKELVATLPDGMATYSTREERISTDLEETDLYEGIGAFVTYRAEPEPHIVILSVIEGSPAEAAGLLAHDSVYAIDGTPIDLSEGIEAVSRIRGPGGSEVTLEVASPGEDHRSVDVLRQQVVASDSVRGGVFDPGIYYVLFPVNSDETIIDALDAVLQTLDAEETSFGIILDLRISSSSPGWPLGELLVLFTEGELGTFFSQTQNSPLNVTGQDVLGSQDIPLVILIGPDTSGAPEIFAAAMAVNDRATLIGMRSPGKTLGFRQTVLSDGSELIFANSSFFAADGSDLAENGLTPHLTIDADWDEVTLASDPALIAAIEILGPAE